MRDYVDMFREVITDAVTSRVAWEAHMQSPQGLTNRSFQGIVGELMMTDWDRLAKLPVKQAILRIVGNEETLRGRGHKDSKR